MSRPALAVRIESQFVFHSVAAQWVLTGTFSSLGSPKVSYRAISKIQSVFRTSRYLNDAFCSKLVGCMVPGRPFFHWNTLWPVISGLVLGGIFKLTLLTKSLILGVMREASMVCSFDIWSLQDEPLRMVSKRTHKADFWCLPVQLSHEYVKQSYVVSPVRSSP